MLPAVTIIMNWRFVMAMHLFLVVFMQISLVQLHAFNPESGNVSVKCIERERQALLSMKQGFQLKNEWLSSWGEGEKQKECCDWEGIQCSNETGHVLKLDLHAVGDDVVTVSSLNPSLSELNLLNYLDLSSIRVLNPPLLNVVVSLTNLRHLNLSLTGFQGIIPHELGNLLFLEYLDLQHNHLQGQIPSQFSFPSHLVYLDLSWNLLQGKIPPELTNMSFLRYIDLSANFFNEILPPQLGNLLSLEYLDLSGNNFSGIIPLHFANLSNLQYLDLGAFNQKYLSSNLQWVSQLSSLRHLSLSGINLSSANNWQQQVSGLSHLQHLDLRGCQLVDSISSSLSSAANFSTSLSFVDISDNHLMNSSLVFPWLMNSTQTLSILRMSNNGLKGTIPEAFRDLSSLEELNLANNQLNGQIPVSLFHSCNLKEMDLSYNRLTGQFHEFVEAYSLCAHKPLQALKMGWNQITGMVPDLSQLSSLQVLRLENNGLNGTIHEGIGQLSNLLWLSLLNNKLGGLISEAHFSGLYHLFNLDLSHNALVFNASSEWVPPFHLTDINFASCNLGPDIPRWLQIQGPFDVLDISQAGIFGTLPDWFWNFIPTKSLNISYNHIRGKIENLPIQLPNFFQVDMSSNLFEGPIPAFLSTSTELFLSHNLFSTANLLLCANSSKNMRFLDLSNNNLRGELPDCWMNFESLVMLDLSNNFLSGNIPRSLGSLRNLRSLHLGGNNFSGEIPLSLINCTNLEVFVASQNHLSGLLPSWIGDSIPNLLVLSLHSNKFYGSIPLSMCNLGALHVLDLSLNDLSGTIPKCISNLSAMATQENSNATITHDYEGVGFSGFSPLPHYYYYFGAYNDSASLTWKGKMSIYGSTLGLLRSIDMSSNRLTGEVPSEMMSLVGLVSLNISRNMLSGEIPPTIGQLKSIDFLDLSRNQLTGRIPSQLSQLDRLSVFDLSYNDLSGEIPLGTQLQTRDDSAYIGNPKLCGAPLNRTCPLHGPQIDENDVHADEQFLTKGFHIAMALGFVIGFWGVCFSLIFKRTWRYAYFKFFNDLHDKLYVLGAIKMAKLLRIRS